MISRESNANNMKASAIFLFLTLSTSVVAIANTPLRVQLFLDKVGIYYDKRPVKWAMPNSEPQPSGEMPSMAIVGLMTLDPLSGLAFSSSTGNLYDPELEVGLEASSGTVVDFKTGKKYSLADLLKQRQARKQL
jgi:hypothetical protein